MIELLHEDLFWDLSRFPENTAVILPDGQSLSYAALQTRVDDVLMQLRDSQGLAFLKANNSLATLVSYLACLQARRAVMLIDDVLEEVKVEALAQIYRPAVMLGPGNGVVPAVDQCTTSLTRALHPDLAVLLSTSGSTGSPKQVRLSFGNLAANAASIAQYLKLTPDDCALTTLPFAYSYGLSVINSHLLAGATLALTGQSLMSREFWTFHDQVQPTSMVGVPQTYQILERLRFFEGRHASLRYMTQAGGRLSPELITRVAKRLAECDGGLYVMYGQTEATARMSYLPPEEVVDVPGSVGRPIPGGEFFLEDESGNRIVHSGLQGELVYRGPNVMMGYANSGAELGLPPGPSELRTGDRAWFDEAGRYFVCGRTDRVIKVFGHRLDLDEIQHALASQLHTDVVCAGESDRLVIGVEADWFDESVAESAAVGGGAKALASPIGVVTDNRVLAKLRNHVTDQVLQLCPLVPAAVQVRVFDRLPRTSSGKVAYAYLLHEC